MPSCLGIYTDNNMVKYAKLTTDKAPGKYNLDAFGVKFYDNIQTTVNEIALEVGMERGPIAVALSSEDYYNTKVFSSLKRKDIADLVTSEYREVNRARGIPDSVSELRFMVFKNLSEKDKAGVLCVSTTKTEIANFGTLFENYKVASIEPLTISIKNILENEGISEECAVVNIEDSTFITVFHASEIQYADKIPLGASEIITRLSEKYNSTSKAYEACKRVSAYIDAMYDTTDEETRDILDVVIPILYEIRQSVEEKLSPYIKGIKKIYITGTGAIINNIDLYFSETFAEKGCTVLRPYFVDGNQSNSKDIIEVNSAIALALDGLGKMAKDFDFNIDAKKAANLTPLREISRDFKLKEKFEAVKEKMSDISKKLNSPPGTIKKDITSKKKRGKVKVDFDDDTPASTITSIGDADTPSKTTDSMEGLAGFGILELWLGRIATLTVSTLIIYSTLSIVSNNVIAEKKQVVESQIEQVDNAIKNAKEDAKYLDGLANNYIEITNKLSTIIAKINKQSKKTYDIPNFLSKLMFIMPANVSVKTIDVQDTGAVTISVESGQYAQLGYLVSKIKLENALLNVDMEVQSVDNNIKIVIKGVLP